MTVNPSFNLSKQNFISQPKELEQLLVNICDSE